MTVGIQKELLNKEKGVTYLNCFTAKDIENILAKHYSKDVFIPQCKNGETWSAHNLLKLDAWVLRRTYSPLTTIGYEIKVSRQDFENDQKWTGYYDLCHLFYFVCPAGLIRNTDVPNNVGITWVSKNGRLHTKKVAERHEPDIHKLNSLLIYSLMSRSKIVENMNSIHQHAEDKDHITQLREITNLAKERGELASFVKGHIKDIYDSITKRERELTNKEYYVNDFVKRLEKLGIKWDTSKNEWQENMRVQNEIDLLKKNLDWRTLSDMEQLSKLLHNVSNSIKELQKDNL